MGSSPARLYIERGVRVGPDIFSLNAFRNRRMWQVLGMVDTNLELAYIDGGRRGNIDDRPVDAVARLSFITIEVTCWIDKTFKTNRI